MNDVSRRSFLFGAVAVPAGIILPAALAAELALPPPEVEKGQSLILHPGRTGAVLDINDLMTQRGSITLTDGGKVLGVFRITNVETVNDMDVVDISNYHGYQGSYMRGLHRKEMNFTMVEMYVGGPVEVRRED